MSNISKLDEKYSVAPQLTEGDFSTIAEAGYKTVVNFRPDGEKPGYLNAIEAQQLAESNGLNYYHIPVPVNGFTNEHVAKLKDILANANAPVLAHCGTGKRASVVWALASAESGNVDDIINCCAGAGHDIRPLRPHLENISSK